MSSGTYELTRITPPREAVRASNVGVFRITGLAGILLFAFWVGMSPHWDYPYPLHVDEWFHLGYAQSTLEAGRLEYPDSYNPGVISFHPEMGFHLLLGFLKTVTGLSWMELYRFTPGVLLGMLTFLTYAFGHRSGFGWAAALFVPLIPTSIRTLGPALVVPITVAMLFIPVTLLLLHTMEGKSRGKALWLVVVLVGGTVLVHPPTEVVVTALAVLYLVGFVIVALVERRHDEVANLLLAIGTRILIPLVILGLWLPSLSKKVLEQSASPDSGAVLLLGLNTQFTQAFGMAAAAISVVGLFFFVARGKEVLSYVLPVFTLLLLAFLVFFFPIYRFGPYILYERGWVYLGLLMAIFAGYGVAVYFLFIPTAARAVASRLRLLNDSSVAVPLWVVGGAVLILALTTSLVNNGERQAYNQYYHVVDQSIAADFRWLGQHTLAGEIVAMGEPSIGWAYPAVAGEGTALFQTVAAPWTNRKADKLRMMLESGEADVSWLRRSEVSLFYTCRPRTFTCGELTNDDLLKVRRGVYLVPEPGGT